jgi:hypothetical protein
MPNRAFFSLFALLALATTVAPAGAAVPSPANSSFPNCLATCPMGDIPFAVTVRDLANNPVGGSSVTLEFASCGDSVFVCTCCAPDPYVYNPGARTITMVTDAAGQATFPLRLGGGCGPGGVRLFADGIFFRAYALASPDQDGNGFVHWVIGNDQVLFNSKLGGTDPTADFDCDGDVDAGFLPGADEFTFNQHVSHACEGFVDAARRESWGRVKQIYR